MCQDEQCNTMNPLYCRWSPATLTRNQTRTQSRRRQTCPCSSSTHHPWTSPCQATSPGTTPSSLRWWLRRLWTTTRKPPCECPAGRQLTNEASDWNTFIYKLLTRIPFLKDSKHHSCFVFVHPEWWNKVGFAPPTSAVCWQQPSGFISIPTHLEAFPLFVVNPLQSCLCNWNSEFYIVTLELFVLLQEKIFSRCR